MKKFFKILCFISIFSILTLVMTSCSGYNFYDDFHGAGADIEKDNIYKVITLEEAQSKKENGDTFVLLYGTSSNSECVSLVTKLQVQAEYLGNPDAVIYYLNSSSYKSSSQREKVTEAINMKNPANDGDPVIMIFTTAPSASRVALDTSNKDTAQTKKFIKNGEIEYSSIASYIFKEILAE